MKEECFWIKSSPSLLKGIDVVNKMDDSKFEQFLKRIVNKMKCKDTEIFNDKEKSKLEDIFQINNEQLLLAIKTIIYIVKRILKYIFMPLNLKTDLLSIGISEAKVVHFVKIWSSETSSTIQNVTLTNNQSTTDLNFVWKLNSELSSDYHKRCKIPKAYLYLKKKNENMEVELTHSELHSIFLQFESIQNDLDNMI